MKIDGTHIASEILSALKTKTNELKKKSIEPHLAVILIGEDPASISFIKQKQKAGDESGVKVSLHHFKKAPLYQEIAEYILKLDHDPAISGIIIQRPLPSTLSALVLNKRISVSKDVDGFLPKSEFLPPLGSAVLEVLSEVRHTHMLQATKPEDITNKAYFTWLKNKTIVLVGRGETGGKPIATTFRHYRINFFNINSRNDQPEEYLKQADIIITAVGKDDVIKPEHIKQGVTLVGVGVHRNSKGKLSGDYDEEKISTVADYYTPTPGGVGPVNVACLMRNVVEAAEQM